MDDGGSLLQKAKLGVIWSIVQNWGSKFFTVALSVVLARLLSPADFGTAAAVGLLLLLAPLIAEMGFGDAIMQRRKLGPNDLNLPFMVSVAIIISIFGGIAVFSSELSSWLGVGGARTYIVAAAGVLLLTTPSMFQEASYKRNMQFKSLALRSFIANIVGGVVAVTCAWAGLGIWSFVVQAYVGSLISVLWIWRNPQWTPSLKVDIDSFKEMTRFGIPVVAQRLVDFAGTKIIDVIIVSQLGMVAYGFYAIGSRIYVTMMQMLQGAFYDVSLTVLSTVSNDRERMASSYLKAQNLAATFISPIFILIAALAPEISSVLLGKQWSGVEHVMAPLLILGAVQSVQFINGPFFSSLGKPEIILIAGFVKTVVTILTLLAFSNGSVHNLVIYFSICQLASTPIVYPLIVRLLGLKLSQVIKALLPSIISCSCSFVSVTAFRTGIRLTGFALADGVILGAVFCATYAVCTFILDKQKILDAVVFIKARISARGNNYVR